MIGFAIIGMAVNMLLGIPIIFLKRVEDWLRKDELKPVELPHTDWSLN